MILFKEAKKLHTFLASKATSGLSTGFVPTMGALHEGHISLIRQSTQKCDITICSIFVNPTQFNDAKDFEKYPITIENDILLLEQAGCDILFLPSVDEMYPQGIRHQPTIDFGEIEYLLEGKFRPGHFQGVGIIVKKLLDIVQPQYLFIGQKDFQQCIIIKKLVQKLGYPTQVVIGETLREASGLAMSSRNMRLNPEQREQATAIHKMLQFIKENFYSKSVEELTSVAGDYLLHNGFDKIDYISIANAETLLPISELDKQKPSVVLIAAFIGGIRLIDNIVLN